MDTDDPPLVIPEILKDLRWEAFTDDELYVLADALTRGQASALAVNETWEDLTDQAMIAWRQRTGFSRLRRPAG